MGQPRGHSRRGRIVHLGQDDGEGTDTLAQQVEEFLGTRRAGGIDKHPVGARVDVGIKIRGTGEGARQAIEHDFILQGHTLLAIHLAPLVIFNRRHFFRQLLTHYR